MRCGSLQVVQISLIGSNFGYTRMSSLTMVNNKLDNWEYIHKRSYPLRTVVRRLQLLEEYSQRGSKGSTVEENGVTLGQKN